MPLTRLAAPTAVWPFLFIALLLAACRQPPPDPDCTDPLGCVFISPGNPIHIAYLLTIEGDTAFLGQDSLGGIELALAERDGTLLDHPIRLTGLDEGCSEEGGQEAAELLVQDPAIVGVIGTNCSASARTAVGPISQAGLTMISPSNTDPALTDPDRSWQPGYFRASHHNLRQGQIAAEYVYNARGARTAATVYDRRPYSVEIQQQFAETFQALGGTITFQGAVDAAEENLLSLLTSIAVDSPDVLFFPLFEPEGSAILAGAAQLAGLEGTLLISSDSLLVDSFPENAGSVAVGLHLIGPHVRGADYNAFLAGWVGRYDTLPSTIFPAFAYDAANLLLDAIGRAAQREPDGGLIIGRGALRRELAETADFEGLTGALTCTPTGDCASGTALGVYRITEAEVTEGAWPPAVVWTP